MVRNSKALSVFLNLKDTQCLPFPGLDQIGQQLIPIFDIHEELSIDASKVSLSHSNI
jgi:hypothetical protein